MAKIYKKISGTWYPIKKIFKRIDGAWSEIKKLYKKVNGTWKVVHSGAYEYTFTGSITAGSSTGIPLSNYINPTLADEFIITVNSGVILMGINGGTGSTGTSTPAYNVGIAPTAGGTGIVGGYCIDFTGFGGKKITFVNNGTIKGGNGGNGGNGGKGYETFCSGILWNGAIGGAGGAGGEYAYNPNSATLVFSNIAPINGSSGLTGATGGRTYENNWIMCQGS